jgi:hypothetical protein
MVNLFIQNNLNMVLLDVEDPGSAVEKLFPKFFMINKIAQSGNESHFGTP